LAFDDIFFIEHTKRLIADFSTVKLNQLQNDGRYPTSTARIDKIYKKITFPLDGSRNHTLAVLIILKYILFYFVMTVLLFKPMPISGTYVHICTAN
jgi:hypothetical protein